MFKEMCFFISKAITYRVIKKQGKTFKKKFKFYNPLNSKLARFPFIFSEIQQMFDTVSTKSKRMTFAVQESSLPLQIRKGLEEIFLQNLKNIQVLNFQLYVQQFSELLHSVNKPIFRLNPRTLDTDLAALGRDHSNDDGHKLIVVLVQQGRSRKARAVPLWVSPHEGHREMKAH